MTWKVGIVMLGAFFSQSNGKSMRNAFQSTHLIQGERSTGDTDFIVAFGVKPNDPAALESVFWKVSDPSDPLYGRHLSSAEIDALTTPSVGAVDKIKRWLEKYEISDIRFSTITNRLEAKTTVRVLEELLQTKMHHYHGNDDQRILKAATPLTIPDEIEEHLSYVNVNTPPLGRSLKAQVYESILDDVRNGDGVTPAFLRKLYNIPEQTTPNATNLQGIPEFYQESWSRSDLDQFFKQFLPNETMPTLISNKVSGRDDSSEHASAEASLDLQYITAIAPKTKTFIWSETGANPFSSNDEPFVAWAEEVLSMEHPPYVVSLSYSDDEAHIFEASESYARSFDTLLMKLGTRGISVIMSSGDDGVAGQRPGLEKVSTTDKANWCKVSGPQWPTSSPFLTSVGATMYMRKTQSSGYFFTNEEVVCSSDLGGLITSGGGFSNKYARPSYQDTAVGRYLVSPTAPSSTNGYYNASGRAYPDVTAFGANFKVVIHGTTSLISGTSASAPVFAGILTLINDMRLNAGKPPLGFVNPLLYKSHAENPLAFNDIIVGNNAAGMGSSKPVCDQSFHATRGWDAASGLGSPNFAILSELLTHPESWIDNDTIMDSSDSGTKTVVVTERLSNLAISACIATIISVFILIVCTICYVRKLRKNKEYQEIEINKPDTPMHPSNDKLDAKAIFTIEDEDDVEEGEAELTEVNLDK
ncbi:tripeptidyl-peptidase [Thraustotheca clavata]|uniref:subtilisin n=1 Tax=Thraustotheca clavata TaxID=74557 RepID=A0A1V9ZWQ0_9STRA|nr:tripeptidyl-peptidase [Thraustotheca clavata]